jgi:hypothetical protein
MKRLLCVLLPMLASAQKPAPPVVHPVDARGARSTTTAFLTTVGKDTFCLEQYSRTGNIISGTWAVIHPPGVFVHDFVITLADDGLPARYAMKYSIPGAPTPPDLDSLAVVYERDSASLEFFLRDSSFTRRIPMHEGFPLLGQSFVGVELALKRLRAMHVDSSTIALHPPSDPEGQVTLAPVRFNAGVAGVARLHLAPDGSILGLGSGRRELRRVPAFEMSSIVDGFVKAFARRESSAPTLHVR